VTGLLTIEQFRAAAKRKLPVEGGVFRLATDDSVPVANAQRTRRFCFSDQSVDRMGDTIAADGWETEDFDANPVALWAHDSSSPPIGRASNLAVEGKRFMGDIEFAPPETYAFAETIYQLLCGRFLRAVSVGFLPLEYSFVDADPDRRWGIDFKRQTLLEISVCPVPANPNALSEARSKGIDTRPLAEWAERALADAGHVMVPRAELDRLRKAAQEPKLMKKPTPRRAGASEDDPTAGGALVGTCGRKKADACGMQDPGDCSVHAATSADEPQPDEKEMRALLTRLLGLIREPGDDGDDRVAPLAHEDSIRMAHKCLRTGKAFMAEGMIHHAKGMSLLDDVVDALNADEGTSPSPDPDADDGRESEKAAQLARAEELRRKHAV